MISNLAHMFNKNLNDDEAALIHDISLLRVQYLKNSNKLNVILKSCHELDDKTRKIIKKIISRRLAGFNDIDLICYRDISNASLEQIVNEFWTDVVGVVALAIPVCKDCLLKSKIRVQDEVITISYGNNFVCKILKDKKLEKVLKNSIEDMFGVICRVELKYDSSIIENDYIEARSAEEKKLIKKVKEQMQNSASSKGSDSKSKQTNQENNKGKANKYNYGQKDNGPKDKNSIMGRAINQETMDIKEIDETSGVVAIKGDIFSVDIKETKTGKKIVLFNITDYTSSITVKCFPRPKDIETVLEEVKKGLFCKVKGEAMMDTFSKEVVIMGRDIVKLEKIEKMDTSEEKRVELHLHTQMSAMDAITAASKLVERAAKWGHKAIAITDHGVAQAYPEAMSAAKKHNVKVIYGIEAYLVDDGVPIVINADKRSIDEEFVVFDLETTGFSSLNDKIIEIGAVKIKNGKIIDSFNEFVNPGIKIPYKITELTGISNGMVSAAETIEEILPRFMEFSKDAVLVAHNASFDTSFIKKNCDDLGMKFNNPIMDTIPLCKFLYQDLKRYKLNVVAKYLGISLESHHRAVDDAKATGEILLCCFSELKDRGINSLDKLNEEFLGNFDVKKANSYHLIILAKNQTGVKNIYKLISESNLKHFHRRPRMPKSLIQQHREGLIIGSACEAGQVYKEALKGKQYEEIEDLLDFYDYFEIQPLGNNNFMIEKGEVKDEEELKEISRRICTYGAKSNKPVVATCDVHFIDPEDAKYRAILMASKGFSDADNQPPLYFRTTNEMLKEFEYLGEEKAKEVVVYNTQKIADMVEVAKPIPDETYPPVFETAEEDLKNMCWGKAKEIYGENLPEVVEKRLKRELDSIIGNGYATLYVIAHKLVAKSYSDGYLVGSRGSVGSSFAATMADITEVNGLPPHYVCPDCKKSEFILDGSVGAGVDMEDKDCPNCGTKYIKEGFDIPFETFLGFEGDKEPDIDLNFSGDNQGDIHKYTEVLFGEGKTFKAGTIGTVAEKTAYGYVKKYLDERGIVVPRAEIDRLTLGCTGVKRTSGQHPGGIMVVPADNEIFNFCPIQRPADDPKSDIITTHFDYHSISGRLLKLDILGHDDPTVLRMLKDITGINPQTVPLGDSKVLSLFTSPEGLGITAEDLGCEVGSYGLPEFGTKFVRQMLGDTQPKTFSDLVRISGLSHGTDVWLNNAQYFIAEGFTTLKDCISTRDDIMVYLIYKGLPPKTAFTIMEKVRKGKGLTEEHEKIMKDNKVPDWYIESCKRIKYMFPKGHAVAYVTMAIRIAYFKVYYPEAYYAAYLTVRADEFDGELISKGDDAVLVKMEELYAQGNGISVKDKGLLTTLEICHEMYLRGIKFLDVDLYKSEAVAFKIEDDGIRMPLSALQGVAENAAKSIVEFRTEGEFISKEDIRKRTKATKTVIETLDRYGCLKGLSETNQLSFF